ncbi:hypothetical protein GOBAR_AA12963 [Gossypium barbadense]|uniref:Pectinesterase n=1 Tax=Gossypium barbadense TaxID=3634 RepID=A0A2P5XWF0_GOSBA|nr:hypothetical protein GOBAR_AA12963 [Gossypium barbadense]
MATKLACFLLFMIMSMAVSPTLSSVVTNAMDYWCDKTPNPQPCKYFMRQQTKPLVPKTKSEFRKVAVGIALERALRAETHTKWLGKKCRNDKEKAAWADCLKLYQQTILQINQTLHSTKCTDFDVQTWLSTALTNLETCRVGFAELRVSDYVLPLIMSNNVSKLISNALALTSNASFVPQSYKHGFPSWLKAGDRKLLQSSSPTPDLVVARDGLGNHRTIKEALDAASKRSGKSRFVIRVKSGIYQENLEIGTKLKNIMLVGDGLRNTIITGSRSVGDGSTTFDSATVRTDPNQNTGIIIHGSRVMATADLSPVLSSFKTFLGRPWKEYSRTVFMKTYLDSLVDPAGWLEWDGDFALNTLFYGEYQNIGPSAPTSRRVKWKGYQVITSATEASKFTVANFIAGTSWLPNAGIPFTSGL